MSVSLITAFVIQTNETIISHAGPNEDGKYSGWIMHGKDKYCRPIITTSFVYDSHEQAESDMRNIVEEIKSLDLTED